MSVGDYSELFELDRLKEMINANIIIIRMNPKGNILYLNNYAQRFFGYSKTEILGKSVIGTILPRRDTAGRDLEHTLSNILRDPEHYFREELENRLKDGSPVWIAWVNKAIRNEQGKTEEILSIGIDITARVRGEIELKEARDHLEERVRERTAKLHELNQSLNNEIDERKRTEKHLIDTRAQAQLYLDLISHDINNMNQISLGYLEMAQDTIKHEGKLEADNASLIEKPIESLQNCSRLIDTVKTLQSIDAANIPIYDIEVGQILRDLKTEFEAIEDRDIKIDLVDSTCTIKANDIVKDVFRNLIGNAIKHSEGPLTIWIHTSPVREGDSCYCKISIEDNGPGISEERKQVVFYRLKKPDKTPGKGIGLYLVKKLVDGFHGQVSVEDRVYGDYTKGTRFTVLLPAA